MPQTHTPYLGHPQAACQNPLAKARSYSNLPQSKRALRTPSESSHLPQPHPRGEGGPCPVLSSRTAPSITTPGFSIPYSPLPIPCDSSIHVRIALSPRTMHQQPQFPGHPLQKRPRSRRHRHHRQPILLLQLAHHRQNRLHRSGSFPENPLHQPEIFRIDPPCRRPLIAQRRPHHLRHLRRNNVRHNGHRPRAPTPSTPSVIPSSPE